MPDQPQPTLCERAAEAMYYAQVRCVSSLPPKPWSDLSENGRKVYRAMADAALSLPGIAIVELPAPAIIPATWDGECLGAWTVAANEEPVSAWPPDGFKPVAMPNGDFISTEYARALAAALLAAAVKAEEQP